MAVHTDFDPCGLSPTREVGTGKLGALITVKDVRRGHPERLLQGLQAKPYIHRN
jgi:hypothetical protein